MSPEDNDLDHGVQPGAGGDEQLRTTVEAALHQLSLEIARLRDERDDLRRQVEHLRARAGSTGDPSDVAGDAIGTLEDRFFAPDAAPAATADRERARGRRWAGRIGMALLGLFVVAVMLLSVGPKVLPYRTYFVKSGSMEPTITTGSLIVLVESDAGGLGEGDIITFEHPNRPGTYVTHRIIGVRESAGREAFVTKGDANPGPDPWRIPAAGRQWRYAFGIPVVGHVAGHLGTFQVRAALLITAALMLVLGFTVSASPRRDR